MRRQILFYLLRLPEFETFIVRVKLGVEIHVQSPYCSLKVYLSTLVGEMLERFVKFSPSQMQHERPLYGAISFAYGAEVVTQSTNP